MTAILIPRHIDPACPPASASVVRFAGHAMGTSWQVLVAIDGEVPDFLAAGLQQQLDGVVAEMSHWEAGSDLGRFNRAPAGSWQLLPGAFFGVLQYALQVAAASDGAYNPAAGALVNRWGFGPAPRYDAPGFVPPSADEARALLAQCRWQALQLDAATRSALQPGGVQLDLSSVAKGFSVDLLARYLRLYGYRHFLVEVGGELRGEGMKPDGQPWWVALALPDDSQGAGWAAPRLALHGLSVATSGDYLKVFWHNGERCAHTLDPRSGQPVRGVASVTVIHPECMAADAWSTALTVLGPHTGMALAEQQGLAAAFLLRDCEQLQARYSRAFLDMMEEQ